MDNERLSCVVWDECKACKSLTSGYPSCAFVESPAGSRGDFERLQCEFIDFLLVSRLAFIKDKQLTIIPAIDIIPHGLREDLQKFSEDSSLAEYQRIVARYTHYLEKTRLYALETINTLRDGANGNRTGMPVNTAK